MRAVRQEPALAARVRRDRGARRPRGPAARGAGARRRVVDGQAGRVRHRPALRPPRPGVPVPAWFDRMPVLADGARRAGVAGGRGRQHHALRRVDRRGRGPHAAVSAPGRGVRAHRAGRRAGRPAADGGPRGRRVGRRAGGAGRALGRERPGIPWDTLLFSAKEADLQGVVPADRHRRRRTTRWPSSCPPTGAFTGRRRARTTPTGRRSVHRVRGRWVLGPRVVVALGVVG